MSKQKNDNTLFNQGCLDNEGEREGLYNKYLSPNNLCRKLDLNQ